MNLCKRLSMQHIYILEDSAQILSVLRGRLILNISESNISSVYILCTHSYVQFVCCTVLLNLDESVHLFLCVFIHTFTSVHDDRVFYALASRGTYFSFNVCIGTCWYVHTVYVCNVGCGAATFML